jgi:CRISPR-associated endonuclease/helicase Cas3
MMWALERYVGKRDRKTGETRSVVGHCLDVAHCAHAMLQDPVVRARFSTAAGFPLTEVHVARLAVLVGLHDFGKFNWGFQYRISGAPERPLDASHLGEALAITTNARAQGVLRKALAPMVEDIPAILQVIVGHHGAPISKAEIDACKGKLPDLWRVDATRDPIEAIEGLLDALDAAFPKAQAAARKFPKSGAFAHLLAGLLQVSDWMGSTKDHFPLSGGQNRPQNAAALLEGVSWGAGFDGPQRPILGDYDPRPLQRVLMEAPLDQLTIAEALTGDGKTEAALILFSRLAEAGLVSSLFFGVPTRSAATKLHARIADTLTARYPALAGHCLRTTPGQIQEDLRGPEIGINWAFGDPRKLASAAVLVGTVDQAMMSTLANKHAWMRAYLLSRSLLVIDEAHASDPYMTTIIAETVHRHVAWGGYALLMSATLGESALAKLLRRNPLSFDEAKSKPYPLVSFGDGRVVQVERDPEQDRTQILKPEIAAIGQARSEAMRRFRDGQTTLWVRSTVQDALRDYDALRATGARCVLHHSRYAVADRALLDDVVDRRIGKKGDREPVIIVSTQTCEQSLDIDADFLVTDACPADVMIQRLGRLGRFRSGQTFAFMVIDPAPQGSWERYLTQKGGTRAVRGQGWAWVYSVLGARAAIEWLDGRETVEFPRDQRQWVEAGTHRERLKAYADELGGDWPAVWTALYRTSSKDEATADANLIKITRPYHVHIVDQRLPTRLGDPTIEVAMRGLVSPFTRETLEAISVPFRWIGGDPEEARKITGSVQSAANGVQRLTIDGLAFRYSKRGLERAEEGGEQN